MSDLMPDFATTLEARLREDAAALPQRATRRADRYRRPRVAVLVTAVAALTAGFLVLNAAQDRATPAAYGKPVIADTPATSDPRIVRQLQGGMSVQLALGPGARLKDAHPFPAFGGTAYVVTGDQGWCLAAPDPALNPAPSTDPTREGVVTCSRTKDIYRFGLYLGVGNNAVVALPANATPPTLKGPDGAVAELEPSDQGVVVIEGAPPGSELVLYGPDGSRRTVRLG